MAGLEELKKELARRLGPVLPDVPAEQFAELIDRMATLQYKYESRRRADDLGAERVDPSLRSK